MARIFQFIYKPRNLYYIQPRIQKSFQKNTAFINKKNRQRVGIILYGKITRIYKKRKTNSPSYVSEIKRLHKSTSKLNSRNTIYLRFKKKLLKVFFIKKFKLKTNRNFFKYNLFKFTTPDFQFLLKTSSLKLTEVKLNLNFLITKVFIPPKL